MVMQVERALDMSSYAGVGRLCASVLGMMLWIKEAFDVGERQNGAVPAMFANAHLELKDGDGS